MNILIIGGTRFMGPRIVRDLVSSGHNVTIFHRGETNADLPDGVQHILGDRNSLADFSGDFRRLKPEVVVDMVLLNEKQTTELVEVMSPFVKRLVVASSCDVYFQYDLLRGVETGPVSDNRLTEDSPLRTKIYPYRDEVGDPAHRLYDYDKILIEKIIMSHPKISGTVLRLPMVYGPNDGQHRFAAYLKRMKDQRPAILLGKRQAEWRTTRGYSVNCARAISLAVTDERASGRIYNVAEPEAMTERELVARLAEILGWPGDIVTVPDDKLPEHLRDNTCWQHHLDIDTSRIRQELGFSEPVSLDAALRETIEWEWAQAEAMASSESEYRVEDETLRDM